MSGGGRWLINACIGSDDVCRAVATLKPLGSGYAVLDLGREHKVIQSLPLELSADGTHLMALGKEDGFISPQEGCEKLGWPMDRIERALVRRGRNSCGDGKAENVLDFYHLYRRVYCEMVWRGWMN